MLSNRLNGAVYVRLTTLLRGARVFERLIFSAPVGLSGGSVGCGSACYYTKWNLDAAATFLGAKIMDFVLKEENGSKYSNLAIRHFIERLPLWPCRGISG